MSDLFYCCQIGNNMRSSFFFKNEASATDLCEQQNTKAKALDIKARYDVRTTNDAKDVSPKEIRD